MVGEGTGPSEPGSQPPTGGLLGRIAAMLSLVQGAIVALGVIILTASTTISAVLGGGSLPLENAIREEQEARDALAVVQEECTCTMTEFICGKKDDLCRTPYLRNIVESTVQIGIEMGTALVIGGQTRNVVGLEDLPPKKLASLENDLRITVELAIHNILGIELATVHEGLEKCECFGGKHQYARLVQKLTIAQVVHEALETSPKLVEKPKWWRDWLLGGGIAAGALMVGGVVGVVVWRLRNQGQAQGH